MFITAKFLRKVGKKSSVASDTATRVVNIVLQKAYEAAQQSQIVRFHKEDISVLKDDAADVKHALEKRGFKVKLHHNEGNGDYEGVTIRW